MNDDNAWRWGAAEALKRLGPAVLIAALKDDNVEVRGGAADALRQLNTVNPSPCVELGTRRDPAVAPALIAALKDAAPALIAALKDDNVAVRREVAWALGSAAGSDAVPALNAALEDDNTGVRQAAALALALREREILLLMMVGC